MGTTLIFVGQQVVTDFKKLSEVIGLKAVNGVPGNSPCIRPYPKPTQVDR
jgi:hypothetical protein